MPYNCCVPQCSSVSNKNKDLGFHKFPKDKSLTKKWLIAIRSMKQPTKHTKICSKHFLSSDYTVTSMGQWRILNYKSAVPSQCLPVRKFDKKASFHNRAERLKMRNNVKSVNKSKNDDPESSTDIDTGAAENINMEINQENSINEIEDKKLVMNISTQTVLTLNRSQLISYNFLNATQLKRMTGCDSKLFNFLCEHLGSSYTVVHFALSMQDELLSTLMKYKLNLYYSTLASFFDVSLSVMRNIITNWTQHMYKCFKKINHWDLKKINSGQYSIVLDCTEFRVERSSDPLVQQATYSQYYGTTTFKVLVGGTESGSIGYVSDVFGGSITDRKITEVSGILDLLKEGDFVLADRGFNISDLLEEKGIYLNIPPFKRGHQLSEEEITKTRAIANRRIIIENLIGQAKKNKILCDRIPKHMWHISNEIVYNCFMLVNFKNPIVTLKT